MKIGKLGPFSFFKNSILTHKKWIFVCVKMIFSDKKKCKKKKWAKEKLCWKHFHLAYTTNPCELKRGKNFWYVWGNKKTCWEHIGNTWGTQLGTSWTTYEKHNGRKYTWGTSSSSSSSSSSESHGETRKNNIEGKHMGVNHHGEHMMEHQWGLWWWWWWRKKHIGRTIGNNNTMEKKTMGNIGPQRTT